jgi:hypothetical protein
VIEGLETAVFLPVPLSYSYDGTSADDYAGLSTPTIGLRYWLPMGLGFFAEFVLPVDTREGMEPAMNIDAGAQFSTKFTEELAFGSELGIRIPFEDGDKYKDGMILKIGVEVDYSIGSVTPYVGADFLLGLTKPQYDGNDAGDAKGLGILPEVGATFAISEMLGAGAYVNFLIGEDWAGKDNTPITIGALFSVNF